MILGIVVIVIFGLIYCNIDPFIHYDIYGHYLRIVTKHYVYSIKKNDGSINLIDEIVEIEVIKEKCNPWMMWWNFVKLKPCIEEFEYESKQTKEIWNKLNNI